MTFKVGDVVAWRSQSAGVWKVKMGTVAMVLPRNKKPPGIFNAGASRDHESYVVRVVDKTKTRLYWPRVSQLTKVENDS